MHSNQATTILADEQADTRANEHKGSDDSGAASGSVHAKAE